MAEDKITDLQRRLDEKLINPNNLNLEQKSALDVAFQEGTLTGYRSVSDMIQERRLARKDVAIDVKKRLEPLAPTSLLSLGIRRGVLAAAGDIVGSFTPYIMDGKKLAAEAREAALAGKSISYIPKIREDAGKKSFETFSNLISKLPGLKQANVFKKTAQVLDNALSSAQALTTGKLAFSQLAKTELKSQALGALGAAGGSVAFDVINLPAKFASAAGEDIAKYDQNELNRLPFADRVTYHAVDNAKQALYWNAGSLGLFSLGKGMSMYLKKWLKLNPENQVKINQLVDNQGLPINIVQAAEGIGGASGLTKSFNKVLALFPFAATEALTAQQKFTGVAIPALQSNIRMATGNIPLLHTEVLAQVLESSQRKTFTESGRLYQGLYENHLNVLNNVSDTFTKYGNQMLEAQRKSGKFPGQGRLLENNENLIKTFPDGFDLPFIPTDNLKSTVENILGIVQRGVTKTQTERMGLKGISSASNDITIRFADEIKTSLNEYSKMNGGNFLTPAQYIRLRQDWNSNYVKTKMADPTQSKNIQSILAAFEKDFNFVGNSSTNASLFQKNGKLKRAYDTINETLGPVKANQFLNEFKTNVEYSNTILRQANHAYGEAVTFYDSKKLIPLARASDPAMLTAKQGMDIFQEGSVSSVESMNRLFKAALDPNSGDSTGVEQLYKMIGGRQALDELGPESRERAQYVMKLLLYRKTFDAFNKNAIVRLSGVPGAGAQMEEPFVERGISTIQEAIELLNKESPQFKKTVQELIEDTHKLNVKGIKLADDELLEYQKRAISPEIIRQALKDNIPINQNIFVRREVDIGETVTGKAGNILFPYKETGRKPLEAFSPDFVKTVEKAKLAQITEGGVLRDVSKAERKTAQLELENIQFRLQGYQGFAFDDFVKDLGLTTKSGEQQFIKGIELANGISSQAAKKHVDNIKDILDGMRRNFKQTPQGDMVSSVTRSVILGGTVGGPGALGLMAGAPGAGIINSILTAIFLKAGAHVLNSPKIAKNWLDILSTGERMDVNKLMSLQPPKRAVFADMFNYLFRGDPDAPKVDPNRIDEEKIIKYLQGKTLTSVPTDKGIYDVLPEEIKNKFNPERLKLRDLKGESKTDYNTYMRGKQVAKFREDLIDNLDTEKGAQMATQPRVAQFIQNPMDLRVPEGAKNIQPQINSTTADVYAGLFPGDTIGATIAQSQQPRPPMMKKGGFVNVKNY